MAAPRSARKYEARQNTAGTNQATYTFDAYGKLTASTGTITNPFRFAGEYVDLESSLYYLRARYYDPTTGQFISIDPLTQRTRQPYAYLRGNPLNAVDPTGLYGQGTENDQDVPTAGELIGQFRPLRPGEQGYGVFRESPGVTRYLNKHVARADLAQEAADGGLVAQSGRRFFEGATSKCKDFVIMKLSNGNTLFQYYAPARTPGYGKLYFKVVDSEGKRVIYDDITLFPDDPFGT